ncbi:MAG: kynureninase [Flavisolibacter sp.]|jgi:kynureninase|nr:kynureninase [Flavisolibacter sp.]
MTYQHNLEFALKLDQEDPLQLYREKFFIPQHSGKDVIYFTGNSLGLQPKTARDYVLQEMDDWAALGVDGHVKARHPWVSYHELFPELISKIVGALPVEVVVMNQLTVNLHVLMASFYRPDGKRYKILCEAKAFPSDQYAIESQALLQGLDPKEVIIEVGPRNGEFHIRTEDILASIEEHAAELAVVMIGGVNYYNGQVMDMSAITRAAHKAGAYAGFDLAHAAGNIKLELHDWDVDFACWCSYKYLNSGPGGVAGIFIHQKHASDPSFPRMAGWWGHEKAERFQMKQGFKAIPTAEGWQLSNAPVLSMAAHKAALDIFESVGMEALIRKSKLLTGFLFFILDNINKEHQEKIVEVITPRNEGAYGCQVSILMIKNGKEVFDALKAKGVVADWRAPNVIRVAPVPLYNSFEEIWMFGNIMKQVLMPDKSKE